MKKEIWGCILLAAIFLPIGEVPAEEGYVVWSDNRNGDWDIYGYDLVTGVEKAICTDSGDQQCPKVHKRKVVWSSETGSSSDIYVHDLDTDETKVICQRSEWQQWPDIWDNKVIWSEGEVIRVYDLTNDTEVTINAGPLNFAKIYGNKIVWLKLGKLGGGPIIMGTDSRQKRNEWIEPPYIYSYDLVTHTQELISMRPLGAEIAELDISNNKIAWEEELWDENIGEDITTLYVYDCDTSILRTIAQETVEFFYELDPREEIRIAVHLNGLSGDKVLWKKEWGRWRGNIWGWWPCEPTHWYINAYDLPEGESHLVTDGYVEAGVRVPTPYALSFNRIVWLEMLPQDYAQSYPWDHHVCVYDMSTHTKTTIRACDDPLDTDYPDVYYSPVSGQVAFTNGTPIQGATVLLMTPSEDESMIPVERKAQTDSNGCYSFSDMTSNSYTVASYVMHGGRKTWNYRSHPGQADIMIDDADATVVEYQGSQSCDIEYPLPVVLIHGILATAEGWASTMDYLGVPSTNHVHQGYICFAVDGMRTGRGNSGWTYEQNALKIKEYIDAEVLPTLHAWTSSNPPPMNLMAHSQGGAISRCFVDKYGAGYDIENLVLFSGVIGGVYRLAHVHPFLCPKYLDVMKVSRLYKFNGGEVGGISAPAYINQNGVKFHYIAACGAALPGQYMEPSPNDVWVYWASAIAENGPIHSLQKLPFLPGWREFTLRMRDTEFGKRLHEPAIYPDFDSKGARVVHTSECHNPDVLDVAMYWWGDRRLTRAAQKPYGLLNWTNKPADSNYEEPTTRRAKQDDEEIEEPASAGVALQHILQDETRTNRVTLDAEGETVFFLGWHEGALQLTLKDPNGQAITPSTPNVDYAHEYVDKSDISSSETGRMVNAQMYTLEDPLPGEWELIVTAETLPDGEADYQTGVFFGGELKLILLLDSYWVKVGGQLVIQAHLVATGVDLSGVTVVALVELPDGSTIEVPLYDDGSGTYTNTYTISQVGRHGVRARATGWAQGHAFERTSSEIPVVEAVASDSAELLDVVSEQATDSDGNGLFNWLEVGVQAMIEEAGDYMIAGRLTDAEGQNLCFANTDCPNLAAGLQTLAVKFSGFPLVEKLADGPYTLAEVWLYKLDDETTLLDRKTLNYETAVYAALAFDGLRPGWTISGRVIHQNTGYGLAGVTALFEGLGAVLTSEDGSYSIEVPHGWSGNVVFSYGEAIFSVVTQAFGKVAVDQVLADAEVNWGARDSLVASEVRAASALHGDTTLQWGSETTLYYDVYCCDDAYSEDMNWTRLAQGLQGDGALTSFEDQDVGEDVMRRFYSVVLAGEAPANDVIPGIIRRDAAPGYTLMAPPLCTDRRFDGELGAILAEALHGCDGGVGAGGDEVHLLQPNSSWRTLYLDASGQWRDGEGFSEDELAPGQGFFVARHTGTTARIMFRGLVGNDGTKTNYLVNGWNLIGLSEGKDLPLKQTLAHAAPVSAGTEEDSDIFILQLTNGVWRRLMYVQGWGAPYDGNWFDLQSFQIVPTNEVLEPGAAYYYQRRGATTEVKF